MSLVVLSSNPLGKRPKQPWPSACAGPGSCLFRVGAKGCQRSGNKENSCFWYLLMFVHNYKHVWTGLIAQGCSLLNSSGAIAIYSEEDCLFLWPCSQRSEKLAVQQYFSGFSPVLAPIESFNGSSVGLSMGMWLCWKAWWQATSELIPQVWRSSSNRYQLYTHMPNPCIGRGCTRELHII